MSTENNIGRREDDERISFSSFVSLNNRELRELDENIRQKLQQAGCREIMYDKWASAYTEPGQQKDLRGEPVMLHKIKLAGAGEKGGLRVILRGDASEGIKRNP